MVSTSPHAKVLASTPEKPAQKRRKQFRPAELTAAALDLFVEHGYAATRLDDVASRAGVSKGTLYLYFESKAALFKAVVEEGIVPVLAAAEQSIGAYHGSSASLLRRLFLGWWAQIGATRLAGIPKLVITEANHFPDVAAYYQEHVIVRGRALLRYALERGIARGEFQPVDVEVSIDVMIAPLIMLLIWQSTPLPYAHILDTSKYLETHLNLTIRGLAVRS